MDRVSNEIIGLRPGSVEFEGRDYTALDAYALMLCRWTRNFALPARTRTRTQLGPYLERVLARPAVVRVFEAEGLAQPWV